MSGRRQLHVSPDDLLHPPSFLRSESWKSNGEGESLYPGDLASGHAQRSPSVFDIKLYSQISTHDRLGLSENLAARFGEVLKRTLDLNDPCPVCTSVNHPAVSGGSFCIPSIKGGEGFDGTAFGCGIRRFQLHHILQNVQALSSSSPRIVNRLRVSHSEKTTIPKERGFEAL